MKTREDFIQTDKATTDKIIKEFEGEVVETICTECNGTGRQKHITRTFLTSACRECEGEGKIVYEY